MQVNVSVVAVIVLMTTTLLSFLGVIFAITILRFNSHQEQKKYEQLKEMLKDAILFERNACAQICEELHVSGNEYMGRCEKAIRSRTDTNAWAFVPGD